MTRSRHDRPTGEMGCRASERREAEGERGGKRALVKGKDEGSVVSDSCSAPRGGSNSCCCCQLRVRACVAKQRAIIEWLACPRTWQPAGPRVQGLRAEKKDDGSTKLVVG